jgi:RNase P/RNase MRP subunit p29
MAKWLKVSLIVVVALGLAVGGVFSARAVLAQSATATPVAIQGGGLYLLGTLTAASASALTMDTGSGVWTVQLTADTKINAGGKVSATYSDLQLNAAVTVQGEYVSPNTFKATTVVQGRLGLLGQFLADRLGGKGAMGTERGIGAIGNLTNTITGTVVSTTSTSITLKTADAQVTVAVDANTQYLVPGVRAATLADIKVDMLVIVQPSDASASKPATLVWAIGAKGLGEMRGFGPGMKGERGLGVMSSLTNTITGTVVSTTTNSITLKTADSQVTVAVDASTKYQVPGVRAATLADIKVDMLVAVQPSDASATKPATAVLALGAKGLGGMRGFAPRGRGMRGGQTAFPGA